MKSMNFIKCDDINGSFGAHDKETEYDNIIISYLNPLFGASIGKDKLNLLLILSYQCFVIFILRFWWVSNLISDNIKLSNAYPLFFTNLLRLSLIYVLFSFYVLISSQSIFFPIPININSDDNLRNSNPIDINSSSVFNS
jgi:hypothetical protein